MDFSTCFVVVLVVILYLFHGLVSNEENKRNILGFPKRRAALLIIAMGKWGIVSFPNIRRKFFNPWSKGPALWNRLTLPYILSILYKIPIQLLNYYCLMPKLLTVTAHKLLSY